MSSRGVNSVGPFGGKRFVGNGSYDDQHTGVRLIKLVYSDTINSIMVEYDHNGKSLWSTKHGEDDNTGVKIVEISLSFPEEYLVSVTGHYDSVSWYRPYCTVITSLTFKSNIRDYGPYGCERGTEFSCPPCKKIVGFHGVSGSRLHSIGAYYEPWPFKIEAIGGRLGSAWDDGIHKAVKRIKICYDENVVRSIQFEYDLNGRSVLSPWHGSKNGIKHTIELAFPVEYIISVSGYLRNYEGIAIGSLTFVSNVRKYGPIGAQIGKQFGFPPGGGKILGFFGTVSKSCLESIGAHTEQAPALFETVGPFGGSGGNVWDDGKFHDSIICIVLFVTDHITGLHFTYGDTTGEPVRVEKHGSRGGRKFEFDIDYPDEFLVSVTGFYGTKGRSKIVKSLTFRSNLDIYGPFGPEDGVSFSISATDCKIIGFHGRDSECINSIGAHMVSIPKRSKPKAFVDVARLVSAPKSSKHPVRADGGLLSIGPCGLYVEQKSWFNLF